MYEESRGYLHKHIGSKVVHSRSTVSFCRAVGKIASVEATVWGIVSTISGSRNHRIQPKSCWMAWPRSNISYNMI